MRGIAHRTMRAGFRALPGNRRVVVYGESLANENGHEGPGVGMIRALANLRPGLAWRCQIGVTYQGGIHADAMRALFEADSARTEGIVLMWIGSNDANDGTLGGAKAEIDACTAALPGGTAACRCIILGPLAGDYPQIKIGGANRAAFDTYQAAMASTYGERYINANALMIAGSNGSAGDLADVADGIVPRSLRCDTIHPTDAGYLRAAQLGVLPILISKGWIA